MPVVFKFPLFNISAFIFSGYFIAYFIAMLAPSEKPNIITCDSPDFIKKLFKSSANCSIVNGTLPRGDFP